MSLLGSHVGSDKRNGFGDLLAAGSKLVVTCDQNVIAEAHKYGAFVAFRTQHSPMGDDNPPGLMTIPIEQIPGLSRDWMDSLKPIYDVNPGADCYIINNELPPSTLEAAQRLNIFYLNCMQTAENWGIKVGICSFATGEPSDDGGISLEQRWLPLLQSVARAQNNGHFIVLHEHCLNSNSMIESGENESLRHQRTMRYFDSMGLHPRVIIGELSNGVGGVEPDGNLDIYMQNVKWWDRTVMDSIWAPLIVGGALYQFGAESISPAVPKLVEWIEDNPTPVHIPPPTTYLSIVYLAPQVLSDAELAEFNAIVAKVLGTATRSADDALAINTSPKVSPDSKIVVFKRSGWVNDINQWLLSRGARHVENREFASSPPPPTPVPHPIIKGVEMRADGHSTEVDFQAVMIAHCNGAKFMSNTGFDELDRLITMMPVENILLRLHSAGDNPSLRNPAQFFAEQRPWLDYFRGKGGIRVEIHNEPNLPEEGLGFAWYTGDEFGGFFYNVADMIRHAYPMLKIGYPGLSPNKPNEPDFIRNLKALITTGKVDWIGAHAYWVDAGDMENPDNGRHYRRFLGLGPEVVITEFANVGATDSDVVRGSQYKFYYESLESGIVGAYAFVTSASNPAFAKYTWVRNNTLTMIPDAVGRG